MPELDGFELMARLKAAHPGPRHHPDDRQPRRSRQKLIRAIRGARVLLHPEAVRPRSAADARGTLPRAAVAPRGEPPPPAAGSRRELGRSARVSAGACCPRAEVDRRRSRHQLPLRARAPSSAAICTTTRRLRSRTRRLLVADVCGPRRLGRDADRRRQVGVSLVGRQTTTLPRGGPARLARVVRRSGPNGSSR